MAGDIEAPRNQSLVRGVALLRAISESPAGAEVTVLSKVTGLPRTTTSRLLRTLESLGAVEKRGTRLWALGAEIARMGRLAEPFHELRTRSSEAVRALAADAQESAMITVVYDTWEIETILQADAPTLVGARNWIGHRSGEALQAGASGKLALADLDDENLKRVARRLRRCTPATITDFAALTDELAHVRRRGWATTVDELEVGLTGIAVPLHDPMSAQSAGARSISLSVSGLSARITRDRLPTIARKIEAVAKTLARDVQP
jgi:IclR family acetate operon transcriptional repressor